MHTLIRAAALALTLQQAAAVTELAAQDAACSLVTEKEVEAATGLDYRPGDEIQQEYEMIAGGDTCLLGGPSLVGDDLPEINITFIAASPGGSHTESRRKRKLRPDCTRDPVSGVGDRAFVESCEGTIRSSSVYAQMGNSDLVVSVYQQEAEEGRLSLASAPKPVAIAIAKAAAARGTGK
jgi:hypothetical protein